MFRIIEDLIIKSTDYIDFFCNLVNYTNAKKYVEIGIWNGDVIRKVAKHTEAIGFDINRPEYIEGYRFYHGKAHLSDFDEKIDIVFQDSAHHFEESKREWEKFSPLMNNGGILLIDDVSSQFHDPKIDPPCKSMMNYFEELPGDKRLYPNVIHKGTSIGIILL